MTIAEFFLVFIIAFLLGHLVTCFQIKFILKHSIEARAVAFKWWMESITPQEFVKAQEIFSVANFGENNGKEC